MQNRQNDVDQINDSSEDRLCVLDPSNGVIAETCTTEDLDDDIIGYAALEEAEEEVDKAKGGGNGHHAVGDDAVGAFCEEA